MKMRSLMSSSSQVPTLTVCVFFFLSYIYPCSCFRSKFVFPSLILTFLLSFCQPLMKIVSCIVFANEYLQQPAIWQEMILRFYFFMFYFHCHLSLLFVRVKPRLKWREKKGTYLCQLWTLAFLFLNKKGTMSGYRTVIIWRHNNVVPNHVLETKLDIRTWLKR